MGSRVSRAGTARPSGAHIFSVAQHSLLVETPRARGAHASTAARRLAILLHDAPEYVIGDMISPFKAVIGDAYKAVEARLLAAIHLRFGLPPALPADSIALIKAARPRRRLSRGDAACRLLRRRGAALLRPPPKSPPRSSATISRPGRPRSRRRAISSASPSCRHVTSCLAAARNHAFAGTLHPRRPI